MECKNTEVNRELSVDVSSIMVLYWTREAKSKNSPNYLKKKSRILNKIISATVMALTQPFSYRLHLISICKIFLQTSTSTITCNR